MGQLVVAVTRSERCIAAHPRTERRQHMRSNAVLVARRPSDGARRPAFHERSMSTRGDVLLLPSRLEAQSICDVHHSAVYSHMRRICSENTSGL